MLKAVLVRYGSIPEVARFARDPEFAAERGRRVVVQSPRGLEIGELLEDVARAARGNGEIASGDRPFDRPAETEQDSLPSNLRIVRAALPDDERQMEELRRDCGQQFEQWTERIRGWNLRLELIDLEWTLDRSKLILYVLNERGPDCTKLALQAAAAGLGVVEVQPVAEDGLVRLDKGLGGGGCGQGGCGCDHH